MNEITVRDGFQPQTFAELMSVAETVAKSELVPAAFRGKPANIVVAIMAGRELGLGAMQSLRLIYVIEGKPVMSADGAVALALSSPHCERWDYIESTDRVCTIETQRKGSAPARFSFTIEQAQQAGIANKNTWKQYPQAMLRARCAMITARAVYPDLLAGVYGEDEEDELRETAARDVVDAVRMQTGRDIIPPPVYDQNGDPAAFRIVLGVHKGKTFAEISDAELSALLDGMHNAPADTRKLQSFMVQLKEAEREMMERTRPALEPEAQS